MTTAPMPRSMSPHFRLRWPSMAPPMHLCAGHFRPPWRDRYERGSSDYTNPRSRPLTSSLGSSSRTSSLACDLGLPWPPYDLPLNIVSFKSSFFVIGIGEFLWIHPLKEPNMIIFHHSARARMKWMEKIDPYKIYFSYIFSHVIYNDSV